MNCKGNWHKTLIVGTTVSGDDAEIEAASEETRRDMTAALPRVATFVAKDNTVKGPALTEGVEVVGRGSADQAAGGRRLAAFTPDGEYTSAFDAMKKDGLVDNKGNSVIMNPMHESDFGFYTPAFYEAFYSFYSFYGFYDFYDFYDHTGVDMEKEDGDMYIGPDGGVLQLCEIAIAPAVGSNTGGTMAGRSLGTSTRPMFHQGTESARLYEH